MRRLLVLSVLLTMIAGLVVPAQTQAQGTPTATSPALGEPSPLYSQDGSEVGTIAVTNIIEPFENYDPGYEPIRGYHYALIEITVTNTAARPFEVDPGSLDVIDSEGFVAESAFISISAADAPVMLEYLDALGPGEEISGAIPVLLFNDSVISRIVYSQGFDSRANVLDLRDELAAAGDPVSVIGASGQEVAQVTVNGVADPFEAYDEFSAPSRGSRYVLVDVTVTNTGLQTLSTSPDNFTATDEQGFYVDNAFVTSTDAALVAFDYIDLAPGEQQQGAIFYQLFAGIPLNQIIYGDLFDRDIVVADMSLGAPTPPVSTAQPTAAASSPDCEGLVEWGNQLVDRLGAAVAITSEFEDIEPADLDPVAIQAAADQLAALAQEQRDSGPPPAAEAFNTFLSEQFLQALSDAATGIAVALENEDQVGVLLAAAEAQAISTLFDTGGAADVFFDDLESNCPNEVSELGN